MAEKADGTIRFETEVDTKGMEDLSKSVKDAADESKKEVAEFAKGITDSMKSELADFGKNLSEGIVEGVKEAMDGATQAAQDGAEDATAAVEQTITDTMGDDALADLNIGDILDGIVNSLSETDGLIGGIAGAVQNIGAGNVLGVLGGINQAIDSLPHGLQLVLGALSGNPIYFMKAIPGIISDIVGGVSRLGAGLKNLVAGAGQKILSGLKSLVSFGGGGGLLDKLASALGRVKSMILSVMIFNQLSKVFRNFTNQIEEVLNRNEAFSSAMSTLKGNITAAFMPIWDVAMPALTALVNMLAQAASWVAQLTAALFGKTADEVSQAAVAFYQEADAIDETGKSVKNLGKASDRYLASFDTIQRLGSGSSGGSGGGGGLTQTAAAGETVTPKIGSDLITQLSDSIKNGDWSAVGLAISSKLSGIFGNLYKLINWENLGPKIQKIAKNIANLINGADWPTLLGNLGKFIGAGVNSAILGMGELIAGLRWDKIAKGFATGINNAIKELDWTKIQETLSRAVRALVTFVRTFIKEFDWTKLGESIGKVAAIAVNLALEFLKGINWADLIGGLGSTVGTAIGTMITSINWANVFSVIGKLFEATGAIGKALLNIGKQVAAAVVAAILDNLGLATPFKGMLNGLISIMNGLVDQWNTSLGGKSFLGKTIPTIPRFSYFALANGAVIPANHEFLAVLGDQKSGTNLEAPESLIRQIVREESGGGGGDVVTVLEQILAAVRSGQRIELNGRELGRAVRRELGNTGRASGTSVIPT